MLPFYVCACFYLWYILLSIILYISIKDNFFGFALGFWGYSWKGSWQAWKTMGGCQGIEPKSAMHKTRSLPFVLSFWLHLGWIFNSCSSGTSMFWVISGKLQWLCGCNKIKFRVQILSVVSGREGGRKDPSEGCFGPWGVVMWLPAWQCAHSGTCLPLGYAAPPLLVSLGERLLIPPFFLSLKP